MKFAKMEGCGNDYIYINGFEENIENYGALSVKISDRHYGVGSDGLVLILPAEDADFTMRMFNPDGSESEMCGNAIRCVGKYVYDRGLTKKTSITVNTLAGIKILELNVNDNVVETVTVDMGDPELKSELIPAKFKNSPAIEEPLCILDKEFKFTCISMGNPHAVTFVDNIDLCQVEKYGSVAEVHEYFPNRANIEFVQINNRNSLKLRVWERGTGETLACGTGACAATVASVINNKCDRKVRVELKGGNLNIEWNEKNNHVYMTGPANFCFDGVWLK